MAAESGCSEDDATAVKQENQHDDDEDDYIKTTTANFVSRCRVNIQGASRVEIKGRSIIDPLVVLRGDLAVIRMGRYSRIGRATTLSPPPLHDNHAPLLYVPMTIGNHTWIGQNCHLQSAAIGAYCWIGNNVTLGPRVLIKDACMICDGVSITADTVVPPFTRISCCLIANTNDNDKNAAGDDKNNKNNNTTNTTALVAETITMELSPATVHMMQEESMEIYQEFAAKQKQRFEQM